MGSEAKFVRVQFKDFASSRVVSPCLMRSISAEVSVSVIDPPIWTHEDATRLDPSPEMTRESATESDPVTTTEPKIVSELLVLTEEIEVQTPFTQ